MTSDRQTAANRLNAKKSTGPRTAEGRARSCLNHITTGIDAQSAIIPGESAGERQSLAERYFDEFQPATEAERHQVDILIHCDWQARRYYRCEAQNWRRSMEGPLRRNEPEPMAEGFGMCSKSFTLLDRRIESNQRAYNRARHELEELQAARFAAEALVLEAEAAAEPDPDLEPDLEPTLEGGETAAPEAKLGSNPQNGSAPFSAAFPPPRKSPQPHAASPETSGAQKKPA